MNREREARLQAIRARVKAAIPGPCHVIYDAYPRQNELPGDNLDEVAATGKIRFFDDDTDITYFSEVVENPTWLTVAKLANEMILTTQDFHHIFLEDIGVSEPGKDGIRIGTFNMGYGVLAMAPYFFRQSRAEKHPASPYSRGTYTNRSAPVRAR